MTLSDNLIFEGLADNFQINVIKGSSVPRWSKSLSQKKAKALYEKLSNRLGSKDEKEYFKVFFENKEFPLWSGYSIGYWIVKSFMKNNPKNNWVEIMKIKSDDVLKASNW
jgi:uncharacterized protein YjaZ